MKHYLAPDWNGDDQETASAEGWNVFAVYEDGKVEMEVFREDPSPFETDQAAREFVAMCAKAGKPLAVKAIKIVFLSKCGVKEKT